MRKDSREGAWSGRRPWVQGSDGPHPRGVQSLVVAPDVKRPPCRGERDDKPGWELWIQAAPPQRPGPARPPGTGRR